MSDVVCCRTWQNFLVHVRNNFSSCGRSLPHSFWRCKGTIFWLRFTNVLLKKLTPLQRCTVAVVFRLLHTLKILLYLYINIEIIFHSHTTLIFNCNTATRNSEMRWHNFFLLVSQFSCFIMVQEWKIFGRKVWNFKNSPYLCGRIIID